MIKIWFQNQSIRNKILIIFLPLIIASLFILALVSNIISTKEIIKKTNKNVSDNSRLIMMRIDSVLANAESCANILLININRIISQMNTPDKGEITDLKLTSLLNNELTFGNLIFPEVESVIFINTDNRIYRRFSHKDPGEERDAVIKSGFLNEIDKAEAKDVWLPMQRRNFLTTDPNVPVLTLVKKMNSIGSGEKMGYIVVNIEEDTFSSIYKDIGIAGDSTYLITDGNGIIISSRNKEDIFKPVSNPELEKEIRLNKEISEIRKINGRDNLVIINSFTKPDWKLVCMIPIKELTTENRKTTLMIFLIGLLCLVFTVLCAIVLSEIIAKPIVRLTEHMLKYKDGNIDIYHASGASDETGVLAAAFNTMISRNKELLFRIDYEQKKKREFELALMQLQIKPHFLYNTLDVICRLADMNRNAEVRKATKALADFYRVALSKGRDIIKLGEEISNVENYFSIQKIRYSNVFDYEITVEDEILNCHIPKLTIQPLAENAIYHGLKPAGRKGIISIKGYKEKDSVVIKVSDDGAGMSQERLNGIFSENTPGERSLQSFGLKNLNERIRIIFGSSYGLTIWSEEGKGTEITIRIPAQYAEVKEYDKIDAG